MRGGKLAVDSGGPYQRQGGAVIAEGASRAELARGIQDRGAQSLRLLHGAPARSLLDPLQAEFLEWLFLAAAALDHSAGNQQQSRTFLQADGWSVSSRMGKQSQRKAGGAELGDSCAVAEQTRSVSGIGVAERSEFLVVAGDKRRAGMNSVGRFDERRD